ncbi:prolyl oligopeptidase family serine peptidase [Erythrobacter sp. AP23]|uniref:carboxylesterase family protein n=1 Tax=Erythrobacter sp. AP23 TaxID=499656 RepID=UPI0009FAC262|nr:prolyl oligopeptidase family serine peptidase [Erythrobacter sp. AP23]
MPRLDGKITPPTSALLLLAACIGVPTAAAERAPLISGQYPQQSVETGGYRYQLFVPEAADGTETWPLMIFLHGSGERGDDIDKVKVHGPPKHAELEPGFPFILISPLLPADQDWEIGKLEAILDHALATLPIDSDRVYLTGLSRGAHATWRWGAHSPERFAALAPVAGTGDPQTACQLVDTPVWALHGDRDDVVPPEGSFAMARAIRNCGGRISRLTIYPDLGHNAWDPAYEDPALYLWLLSQRRARKKE